MHVTRKVVEFMIIALYCLFCSSIFNWDINLNQT